MEKSIESIWKKGFLNSNAVVGPQINNLFEKKSTHLIDKFKKMVRNNLIAIVVGSILVVPISYFVGIPAMGIGLFFIANSIVLINRRLEKTLLKIDVHENCYDYLKHFNKWLDESIKLNSKMARIYYPLIFLSMIAGFWFSNDIQSILESPNQIYFYEGIPVFWVTGALIISTTLYFFGGKIYEFDLYIAYGRILKKLNELLKDMETLKENNA